MSNDSDPQLAALSRSALARENLSTRSATVLKRYLLTEGLEPGDKLPSERRLAEALNVSRTVLREAINQLVGEGYIHKEPSRSPTVTEFDRERLAEVLDEPELLAFGSVREVAGQLRVDPDRVDRFAQELGYTGYSNMQARVRDAYLRDAGLQPRPAAENDTQLKELLEEQRTAQRSDLIALNANVTIDDIEQICSALEGAHRVVVYGEGAAASLSGVLVRMLHHVGIRAEVLPGGTVDVALGTHDLGPDDVVLGIALWLPFTATINIMRRAHERGCTTIAFTGSPGSPITHYAKQVAVVPAQGTALSFSVLGTVALFEDVILVLARRNPQRAAEIQQALHDGYVREGGLVHMKELRGR